MKRRIRRQLEQRKRKIEARLAPLIGGAAPRVPGQPELSQQRVHYEVADRVHVIGCGGIGAIHQLVTTLGLAEHLDERVQVLKLYRVLPATVREFTRGGP